MLRIPTGSCQSSWLLINKVWLRSWTQNCKEQIKIMAGWRAWTRIWDQHLRLLSYIASCKTLVCLNPSLAILLKNAAFFLLFTSHVGFLPNVIFFLLIYYFNSASCGDILGTNTGNKNHTFVGSLPANPGSNNKCVWIIVVHTGQIELVFKDKFQVTSRAQDCKENFVQVQDGRYR